jgi:hypothetical protein
MAAAVIGDQHQQHRQYNPGCNRTSANHDQRQPMARITAEMVIGKRGLGNGETLVDDGRRLAAHGLVVAVYRGDGDVAHQPLAESGAT